LPPNVFGCWNKGLIEQFENEKEENHVQTQIPYHQISGNTSWKCSSLQNLVIPLLADELNFNTIEMVGAESFLHHHGTRRRSFPCKAKDIDYFVKFVILKLNSTMADQRQT
jgi:hypothetical protein